MDVMSIKDLSPDDVILWQWGAVRISATLVYTWLVMGVMVLASWLATRKLSTSARVSRWQSLLEVVVGYMRSQIGAISNRDSDTLLPFVGTLFLFIAVANCLGVIPGFVAPTASLSTTAALATCVFLAVPIYGIASEGLFGYLRHYIRPTPFMLPFHVIGELSRTLALAVRLFGNVMSGAKIVAILLLITPLVFPVVMHAFGLLTGIIQAYIFAILAIVYIASASRARAERDSSPTSTPETGETTDG